MEYIKCKEILKNSHIKILRLCVIILYFFILCDGTLFAQTGGEISSASSKNEQKKEAAANAAATRSGGEAVKILSLPQALKKMDASLIWDSFFQSCLITSDTHSANLRISEKGKNTIVLYDNNLLFNMHSPFLNERGDLMFPETFVMQLAGLFKKSKTEDASKYHIAAIIVDPGHGGKDPGAIGDVSIGGKKMSPTEKDIVLKVSTELYKLLQKTYPDKKLIMTRKGDTFPSLDDRVKIANNVTLKDNEAIIYVSVHANASFKPDARGYEVWYLPPEIRRDLLDKTKKDKIGISSIENVMLEEQFTTESRLLSSMIADQIGSAFSGLMPPHGSGIKTEKWYVVKNARMPAVLVELGFVSNSADAELMLNQPKKFADAIYNGIASFVRRFESSGGFTEAAK
ncbi:MAG: N-acetylmuramoyl-L-alanine amidase [Termitinemataceae bacterium]|nr:MAG: N-acetylmuramoyl-L-alanine amidase [Termitinemataceae bacterium]